MSLIGDEIGAQNRDVDEEAPSPWETIEPEEADRQPVEPAAAERIPPSPGVPGEGVRFSQFRSQLSALTRMRMVRLSPTPTNRFSAPPAAAAGRFRCCASALV